MSPEPTRKAPLEQRIQQAGSKLSTRRRALVEAILNSAEDTYYLSSRKMARRYGVDAATIVRTIQALGYDQFADFASDLRSYFVTRITPYQTLKSATRDGGNVENHVSNCMETDRANFEALRRNVPPERVVELARRLDKARQVVVVGVDLAYSLSWYLAYGLTWLGFRAEAPVGSTGNLIHRVRAIAAGDILIAISFGRCLRSTVAAARLARDHQAWTFGITDAGNSPIAEACHDHWVISVTNASFNGSYVAPQAAMDALLVACAHLRSKRSLKRLREIDLQEKAAQRWYGDHSVSGKTQL